MPKTRILIVDDSVVIRRLLADILGQEPDLEVVGSAANGKLALLKLPQLNPDVVTLDIEMPDMDGLETLPLLRKTYPKLPVIMFSTLTQRGAAATLDALARGATDYVAKPANVGGVAAGIQSVRDQLLPKIRALHTAQTPVDAVARPGSPRGRSGAAASIRQQRVDAVCVGCSTGGPQALGALLRELPGTFPAPIAVVQHMPPVFTQHLAQRLDQECALRVREARDGDRLEAGLVLIAPGDFHMTLARHGAAVVVKLDQQPPENSCRPAVDVLFRTAAATYGAGCLGVVLTGMGQDGLRGSQEIAHHGGGVIVQDQASSVVWGMPRAVAEAGLARAVLPLTNISQELIKLAAAGRRTSAQPACPIAAKGTS
ncbi:MAG: chemotaxis response regulator protein-glutamate methylesterase [Planctomycetaceae bacterium]|nr:chemotaxis response regulator protein-glutamate methylesterase [Planctomycetaceae bacterium]